MPRYSFDLHLHSCLSPCGSELMTPATVAGLCRLAGIQIAALTDHNTCGNCGAFLESCERYGVLGIPGMELCTAEEVHVICLFETLEGAQDFSARVYKSISKRRNDPEIFGRQILMNAKDAITGEEEAFLNGASDIGIYEAAALAESFGGVAYPAHIDRSSFSLLSNLGLWDDAMHFPLAELSLGCPDDFPALHPDLSGVRFVRASDAHYIEQIPDAFQYLTLPELSGSALIKKLRNFSQNY